MKISTINIFPKKYLFSHHFREIHPLLSFCRYEGACVQEGQLHALTEVKSRSTEKLEFKGQKAIYRLDRIKKEAHYLKNKQPKITENKPIKPIQYIMYNVHV